MRNHQAFLLVFFLTSLFFCQQAEAGPDHSHDRAGPKGGRLLEATRPEAEFLIDENRFAVLNFYSDNLEPVPVSEQSARLIVEGQTGKIVLDFEKKDGHLQSPQPLPQGKDLPLVIQFRQAPEEKLKNFRIVLDERICGECHLAEYACICGH